MLSISFIVIYLITYSRYKKTDWQSKAEKHRFYKQKHKYMKNKLFTNMQAIEKHLKSKIFTTKKQVHHTNKYIKK